MHDRLITSDPEGRPVIAETHNRVVRILLKVTRRLSFIRLT
jgi:hypothetical protein